MSNAFNRYYESELNNLKGLAAEFAATHPALAPMLASPSGDPDVERLLEGVAFLTGLTRQKLDDEFPEFIQEIAQVLFPHYLRPIPAATLMRFCAKGPLAETAPVPAGTQIDSSPVDGTRCRFRTTHDLNIEPLELTGVALIENARAAPVLELTFNGACPPSIRLFLSAGHVDALKLFLLLNTQLNGVSVGVNSLSASDHENHELGVDSMRCAGFDQPLLPYPGHTLIRDIQDYFVLPEKFLFIDVNLASWRQREKSRASLSSISAWRLRFTLSGLPDWMPQMHPDSFMLNVTPAVNLFSHTAAPINHEHRASEYRVIPEGKPASHYQIHTIDQVIGYQQGHAQEQVYAPFNALQRHSEPSYRASLRASVTERHDDVFLSVNYPQQPEPSLPTQTLSIKLTCTNRALPERLQLGDICHATSTSPARMTFSNIRSITPTHSPPSGQELLWRVLSHTSLNALSVLDAEHLKALLSLHLFEQRKGTANRRRIDGIQEVRASRETRIVGRASVLPGQLIHIKCCSANFACLGDMYLLGCVLERFFGAHASIGLYTRVEMEDTITGAVFAWPLRLGTQTVL